MAAIPVGGGIDIIVAAWKEDEYVALMSVWKSGLGLHRLNRNRRNIDIVVHQCLISEHIWIEDTFILPLIGQWLPYIHGR